LFSVYAVQRMRVSAYSISFISHRHDRQTLCLYLIQQRPKTSLDDPACIWYSERLICIPSRPCLYFYLSSFCPLSE
jgi:hypothetical protein